MSWILNPRLLMLGISLLATMARSGTSAQAAESVSFALGYFTGPLVIVGANSEGNFKNLPMRLVEQQSGAQALPLIASGSLAGISDVAEVPLVIAFAKNIALKVVWINGIVPDTFLVKPDITAPNGLKGKKLAAPGGALPQYLLEQYLAAHQMNLLDINFLDLDPASMVAAYKTGAIDGVVVWSPYSDNVQAAGAKVVEQFPAIGYLAFSAKFVEQHPDVVQAFVCDMAAAHSSLFRDPHSFWQKVALAMNTEVSSISSQMQPGDNVPPASQATAELMGASNGQPGARYVQDVYGIGQILLKHDRVNIAPSVADVKAMFDNRFAKGVDDGACSR